MIELGVVLIALSVFWGCIRVIKLAVVAGLAYRKGVKLRRKTRKANRLAREKYFNSHFLME
jgi:hypothetical protein